MIAPPDPPQAGRRDRVPGRIGPLLVAVAIVVAVVLGCDALRGPDRPDPLVTTASPPSPSTSVPTEAVATDASPTAATAPVTATVTASTAAASTPAAATSAPAGPVADGSIALIDGNGALVTVDAGGGSRVSYPVPGIATGFPAWSPDGSRIAVVAQGAEATAVAVHEVDRDAGAAGEPTVVYRSRDRLPFYLYWTPDSRHVSFLTGEPVGLALRVAAVDGSADSDAVDETSVVRRGSPLYVQWIVADRALLHVGGGSDAFTGRVDLDGNVIGGPLEANGAFRAPGLSRSGRYVTYARSVADGTGEIVVEIDRGVCEPHDPDVRAGGDALPPGRRHPGNDRGRSARCRASRVPGRPAPAHRPVVGRRPHGPRRFGARVLLGAGWPDDRRASPHRRRAGPDQRRRAHRPGSNGHARGPR